MSARILVVDDEMAIVQALKTLLTREGYQVNTCDSGVEALKLVEATPYDLMISDIMMRPLTGIELLKKARALQPDLAVIMITGFGTVETAVQSMKAGAFDFITKPFRIDELVLTVERALTYSTVLAENRMLKEALAVRYHFASLVGESPRMRQVYELITRVANESGTILLQGETGTGKKLAARAIHAAGQNCQGPFVELNCGFMENDELEQRLFGGDQGQPTAFEEADGGTLFIDEIAALERATQFKLAQVLKQVDQLRTRQGSRPVFRLLVSSSVPLEERVKANRFNPDLLYNLAATHIELPPLRTRPGDLPSLIRHFLSRFQAVDKRLLSLDQRALAVLEAHDWPENVRELEQTIMEAAGACPDNLILFDHLPEALRTKTAAQLKDHQATLETEYRWRSLKSFLRDKEQEYVRELLRRTQGDQAKAAGMLGLSVDDFRRKYGVLLK